MRDRRGLEFEWTGGVPRLDSTHPGAGDVHRITSHILVGVDTKRSAGLDRLKSILAKKLEAHREQLQRLLKEKGQQKVGEVAAEQIFAGSHGIRFALCDTSSVPPDKGLI